MWAKRKGRLASLKRKNKEKRIEDQRQDRSEKAIHVEGKHKELHI